jgi:hypothetical protein
LPLDPRCFYPVCTGGQRPAPPEHIHDAWTYLGWCAERGDTLFPRAHKPLFYSSNQWC